MIDVSYRGLALEENPEFWLGIALEKNLEYQQLRFEAEKSKEEFRISETTYIPTIGADFSFSLSGEQFPLYEPGFSFKLTFSFPFNEVPTKVNLDATTDMVDQRTMAAGFNADLFPDLNYLADRRLAMVQLRLLQLQLDSTQENLRFNIEQFLKNYTYETANLELRRQTIKLMERRLKVYQAQLGIGEIKRIDYLKAQNEYYREEIGLRESILSIMYMERSFEQLLGLAPGELRKISMADR